MGDVYLKIRHKDYIELQSRCKLLERTNAKLTTELKKLKSEKQEGGKKNGQ